MESKSVTSNQVGRVFILLITTYCCLVVLFYYLTGDQLHLRRSRGSIDMFSTESGIGELTDGIVLEQRFFARIMRLESVSAAFGNSYRTNHGTITMQLLRDGTEDVLMEGSFDASTIGETTVLSITSDEPVEGLWEVPLLLRIYADSTSGDAVTPLYNLSTEEEGFALMWNGEVKYGVLSFGADGEDYIWIGKYYWQICTVFGIVLFCVLLTVWLRFRKGKRSYLISAIYAVNKYRFLIRQLVERDFKKKYARSVLGMFWSFLNPLLMMIVQYFVFSTIFKSDISNYPAYLIIGMVMYSFFSEACGMTLLSVLENASLITKVYMPKYIYPLTKTMSSVVNFGISLFPMFLVCIFTGVDFKKSIVLSLFFYFCLIIFSLGLGMLLSVSMVFFRDTQFLWGVISMMWMYATPIFYPESIIPDDLKFILAINPLALFVKNVRLCILDGISPEPMVYIQCILIAFCMLIIGGVVFYKKQDQIVLYL